jgi:hypothetical protein
MPTMTIQEPGTAVPREESGVTVAWKVLRPALVLGGAIAAALVLTLFIVATASRLLAGLVGVAAWAVRASNYWLGSSIGEPHVTQTLNTQLDLGIGAFGAAVLVATLRDISGAVVDVLSKWRSASGATLATVFVRTLVGATGLWLSVYGAEKLTNGQGGQTLTIDATSMPPAMVDPNSGNLTFYVGFYAEGGPGTFETPKTHQSVNVASADEEFLKRLRNALNLCGTTSNKVKIRIDGFASGSQWTTVASDLAELQRRTAGAPVSSAKAGCSTTANSGTAGGSGPGTIDDALACIAYYKREEVDKNATTNVFEDGKAFNVYLANMRRLQVARRLGLMDVSSSATVTLVGSAWSNFTDMESALVVDDKRPQNNFAVVGLLTRSAKISIESAAGCARPISGVATRTQLVLQ